MDRLPPQMLDIMFDRLYETAVGNGGCTNNCLNTHAAKPTDLKETSASLCTSRKQSQSSVFNECFREQAPRSVPRVGYDLVLSSDSSRNMCNLNHGNHKDDAVINRMMPCNSNSGYSRKSNEPTMCRFIGDGNDHVCAVATTNSDRAVTCFSRSSKLFTENSLANFRDRFNGREMVDKTKCRVVTNNSAYEGNIEDVIGDNGISPADAQRQHEINNLPHHYCQYATGASTDHSSVHQGSFGACQMDNEGSGPPPCRRYSRLSGDPVCHRLDKFNNSFDSCYSYTENTNSHILDISTDLLDFSVASSDMSAHIESALDILFEESVKENLRKMPFDNTMQLLQQRTSDNEILKDKQGRLLHDLGHITGDY